MCLYVIIEVQCVYMMLKVLCVQKSIVKITNLINIVVSISSAHERI